MGRRPLLTVFSVTSITVRTAHDNPSSPVGVMMYEIVDTKKYRDMSYYIATTIKDKWSFDEAIEKTTQALKEEGFGVLTEIDVKATLKKKLDVDYYNYKILGACNPPFAHKALQAEDKIGVMLPCNVIVQEKTPGTIEISAVDPLASMQAIDNPALADIAQQVKEKLQRVIQSLEQAAVHTVS